MHVRVVQQVLTPGVKHGKKAEARPQMSPIGSDGEQGLGHSTKQESIEPALILQTQVSEGLGNSEHHVAVGYGQQLLGLLGQPAVARCRLALGAVTITAGVESDHPMSAGIALLQPTAQGGGAASREVMKRFPLGSRDGVPPAAQEALSVLAKDLGNFQPRFPHLLRPSPSEVSLSAIARLSRGLAVVRSLSSETCR